MIGIGDRARESALVLVLGPRARARARARRSCSCSALGLGNRDLRSCSGIGARGAGLWKRGCCSAGRLWWGMLEPKPRRWRSLACAGVFLVACEGLSLPDTAPPPPSPEARQAAERIFRDRCLSCHGPLGDGRGLGSKILNVPPRDFTHAGWQGSVSDQRIANVVINGGGVVGLSPLMPANPDLEDQDEVVAALVELIRAFGVPPQQTP